MEVVLGEAKPCRVSSMLTLTLLPHISVFYLALFVEKLNPVVEPVKSSPPPFKIVIYWLVALIQFPQHFEP